jgi:hypothetical protein
MYGVFVYGPLQQIVVGRGLFYRETEDVGSRRVEKSTRSDEDTDYSML